MRRRRRRRNPGGLGSPGGLGNPGGLGSPLVLLAAGAVAYLALRGGSGAPGAPGAVPGLLALWDAGGTQLVWTGGQLHQPQAGGTVYAPGAGDVLHQRNGNTWTLAADGQNLTELSVQRRTFAVTQFLVGAPGQ